MLMRHLAILFTLTASTAAMADALDINLNNNTAQFQYGTATAVNPQGRPDIHIGLLYNNANSVLSNMGILVTNSQENAPGFSIGVGVEALAAQIRDNPPRSNASAVALDGLVRFSPPGAPQLGLAGELHYAPRIITFGDADRYMLAEARVEFEISPQTLAYAGYRRISFGIKNGPNAVLDNGLHLGIKIGF